MRARATFLVSTTVWAAMTLGAASCQTLLGDFTLAGDAGSGKDAPEGGGDATADSRLDALNEAANDTDFTSIVEAGLGADRRADDAVAETAADSSVDATTDSSTDATGDAPIVSMGDADMDAPVDAGQPCPASTPDLCGAICTSVTSDANNCGRCGHPCGEGGKCTASMCQPIAILSPTYYPTALAIDATSVYWVETQDASQIRDNGSVKKAPLAGGGGYTILAAQQGAPLAIAVGPSGVFWLNAGGTAPGGLLWMAPAATSATAVNQDSRTESRCYRNQSDP